MRLPLPLPLVWDFHENDQSENDCNDFLPLLLGVFFLGWKSCLKPFICVYYLTFRNSDWKDGGNQKMVTIYLFPLVCCWISMHSWWEPISFMWEHFATNVFLLSNKYSPLCEQYFHINHWTHLHNCFLFAAFIIFIGQKWTWNPCHEAFAPQAGSNYLPCGLDQWHTWNKSGKAGKARDHKEQPTSVKGTRVLFGHIQIYLSLKYFSGL